MASRSFETQHFLTSEPGEPPASKQDRHLFGGGFYSSEHDIPHTHRRVLDLASCEYVSMRSNLAGTKG